MLGKHLYPGVRWAYQKSGGFLPFSKLGTAYALIWGKPPQGGEEINYQVLEEHIMFKSFEAKKTFSVMLCTVLFSATCVLSAVGPAGAVEVRPASVAGTTLA